MSKRSSRRKRRTRKQRREARLTGPVLTQQGDQAFQAGNYEEAISLWEKARLKKDAPAELPPRLAEAYFRFGVSQPGGDVPSLKKVLELQPEDALYRYHLALALHRNDEYDEAETLYRELLAEEPPFTRAAEPLAQLLIRQKRPISKISQETFWQHLTEEQENYLIVAEALLTSKAESTLKKLKEMTLPPLWAGLLAYALGDGETVLENLTPLAKDQSLRPMQRYVAQYYVALTLAQNQQWMAAQAHFAALDTPDVDFESYYMAQNAAWVLQNVAIQHWQAGDVLKAITMLENSSFKNTRFGPFYTQLNLEAAYTLAQKNNWAEALSRWQWAEQHGDETRRLLFNLALAYQKQQHYLQAAEHWRTLLRRRPRKANDPDALTDQQVARIWQAVGENYSVAGEYEEATKTYKNAVKWNPDSLDTRLQLVEALQNDGRWQAAENELNRILEKDPKNIRALIMLGESYADDYPPEKARRVWRRVLEIEPQNPIARQQLAESYIEEAMKFLSWFGTLDQALSILEAGLEEIPDSVVLHTVMATVYAEHGKPDKAKSWFSKAYALNPNEIQTPLFATATWTQVDNLPEARYWLEIIKKQAANMPADVFFSLTENAMKVKQPVMAKEILDYVLKRYSDNINNQVMAAIFYIQLDDSKKALSILRPINKAHPDHLQANVFLAHTYFRLGQEKMGKRYLDKATQIARKINDHEVLYQVQLIKDEFLHDKAPPSSIGEMLRDMPPEMLDAMLEDAPPEVVEMVKNMPPEMLDLFGQMGFDEDDF